MGAMSGSASTEIDAPMDAVWAVVEDVAAAPEWQKGLDTITVLERDERGRAVRCETTTDAKLKVFTARVRFEYASPSELTWTQERGDLRSMEGSWQLEDAGDGRTRATYTLDGDPGVLMGRFLKGALEARIRGILIEGRPGELKARVEGG
jgi:ribosome-associated toxin RatA of RatAB toxin-antitoxin module